MLFCGFIYRLIYIKFSSCLVIFYKVRFEITMSNNLILHIITGLGDGGAEGVLFRLITSDLSNRHVVISLMDGGKYQDLLISSGIDVYCLNFGRGRIKLRAMFKLFSLIKSINPSVVQTWMYHSDLIGGFVAKVCLVDKVIWNIRHSNLSKENTKKSTIMVAKVSALFSYLIPDRIVCCAEEAKKEHLSIGYSKSKMVVINNGYDFSKFKPLATANLIRIKNGISSDVPLLGMVGRYTPEKDHENLFKSLSILKKNGIDFNIALAGVGITKDNEELISIIKFYRLDERVILLGPVSDVPELMNQLDLHILSSSSEGFPNVLAEAMACGIPCIATNAGSSEFIVKDTGWIVPTKDSVALASSIQAAIEDMRRNPETWKIKKSDARSRINLNFSLEKMVSDYLLVWK